MCSRNESKLSNIPYGDYCYNLENNNDKCDCELDCECKVNLVKKYCPYYFYIDDGLTKCTLLNITSEDDEMFEKQVKICGFNELE